MDIDFKVTSIQGISVSTQQPNEGQVLTFEGSSASWIPKTTFTQFSNCGFISDDFTMLDNMDGFEFQAPATEEPTTYTINLADPGEKWGKVMVIILQPNEYGAKLDIKDSNNNFVIQITEPSSTMIMLSVSTYWKVISQYTY